MPDEPLVPNTPSPSDTPASAGVPVMPDPQKLVDEALTPASVQPPMPSSSSAADTPSLSPLESATPTEVLPPTDTSTPTSSAPMTDEMPLAFAGAPTPAQASPELAAAVASQSLPPLPTPDAPMMTPPPAPLPPIMPATDGPKPKKGMGKVIGAIVGLFLLLGGIGGGYWYYVNNFGETGQVAEVNQSCYDECRKTKGHQVCTCNCGGACTRPDSSSGPNVSEIGACDAAHPFPCGKTPDGSCGGFCITGKTMTCDQALKQECNFDPVRGANYQTGYANKAACPAGYQSAWCSCGGVGVCFDRGFSGENNTTNQCDTPDGLCAVYKNSQATGGPGGVACGTTTTYYCTKNVDLSGGKSCDTSTGGTTTRPPNFCGVIQVDTACQGFKTTIVPCDSPNPSPKASPKPSVSPNPSPSPSPSPTLACTGLTKDKATPKKGDKVTFTCKGATTNAGNPKLTYQFRLRKDSGEWTSLTATDDKASYTVTAAGSYEVQCKACGILKTGAASTCDPEWSTAQ